MLLTDACNKLLSLPSRLSAWATQHQGNVAAERAVGDTASDLNESGNEPRTSRADAFYHCSDWPLPVFQLSFIIVLSRSDTVFKETVALGLVARTGC